MSSGSPFEAFMLSRLPRTVELPDIFRELFGWIDDNGWVGVDRNGEPYGTLVSLDEWWLHDGTSITFSIEPPDVRARSSELWTGVPGLHDVLVPFADTGGEGSQAAFWAAPDGIQRIVHLGSGSGSVLTCVLATEPIDFLRLLAIGYDELCWMADPRFAAPPVRDDDFSPINEPFRDWVLGHGVTIPRTARELVPHPAKMTDVDSPDPFCSWLVGILPNLAEQ